MREELLSKARSAADAAQKAGADDARAYVQRSREVRVEMRDGKVDRIRESTRQGLYIELFVDGRAFDMQWQKDPTEGCYQIGVSPGKDDVPMNAMVYQKTLAGLQSATTLTDTGYIIEIGIPLTPRNFPAGEWKAGRPIKLSV